MKTVNVRFFAFPEEIIHFLKDVGETFKLELAYLVKNGNVFTTKHLGEDINDLKKGNCTLVLSQTKITTCELAQNVFEKLNNNALYVSLGEYSDTELKESWMFSLKIADNEKVNIIWNKVEKKLKMQTKTGGYSVFEPTKEKRNAKLLRYYPSVIEAYKEGIKIAPAYGKNIYFELY